MVQTPPCPTAIGWVAAGGPIGGPPCCSTRIGMKLGRSGGSLSGSTSTTAWAGVTVVGRARGCRPGVACCGECDGRRVQRAGVPSSPIDAVRGCDRLADGSNDSAAALRFPPQGAVAFARAVVHNGDRESAATSPARPSAGAPRSPRTRSRSPSPAPSSSLLRGSRRHRRATSRRGADHRRRSSVGLALLRLRLSGVDSLSRTRSRGTGPRRRVRPRGRGT